MNFTYAYNAILLKKKVKKDGKKVVRYKYLPYTMRLDRREGIHLPTLKKTLNFKEDPKKVQVIQLMEWMKKRLDLQGYEIFATSGGWNHKGKAIDRTWLLRKQGRPA